MSVDQPRHSSRGSVLSPFSLLSPTPVAPVRQTHKQINRAGSWSLGSLSKGDPLCCFGSAWVAERGWVGQQKALSFPPCPSRLWVMSKFKAEVQRQQTKNKAASFFARGVGWGGRRGSWRRGSRESQLCLSMETQVSHAERTYKAHPEGFYSVLRCARISLG